MECFRDTILVYRYDERFKSDKISGFIEEAIGVAKSILNQTGKMK